MSDQDSTQLSRCGPSGGPLIRAMFDFLTAASMVFCRGRAARAVVDLAELGPEDRVVDIGCGPGTAVRVAAAKCGEAIGIDPSPSMLWLGRWLNATRRRNNVILLAGAAEDLPLPDRNATIVWAISSSHHWSDRAAGLAEAHRVLVAGGRLLLAERLVNPGAHGHEAHGLTTEQAAKLEDDLASAGFAEVRQQVRSAGRRTLVVLSGSSVALP